MSPAGKGSPGKGGKAAGGKAGGKTSKGSASRATATRRPTPPGAAPSGRGASSRAGAAVKAAPGKPARPSERPRLRTRYASEIRGSLQNELGLANTMLVPRMEKIVLNMGVGKAVAQASLLEGAVRDLTVISGQRPIVTKAKKSIAAFKLRQGNAIGPRSPCGATGCGSFSTGSSPWPSPGYVTSGACRRRVSTDAATTPSASTSS